MNTFKLFSAAAMLTLTALTSGCASDDEVLKDNTDKGSGTPQETITVGTESTRVAYDDETLKLTWQDKDTLAVVGFDGSTFKETAKYDLSDGADSQLGSFTGNKIDGANKYNVYYPAASVKVDDSGNATFTLGEQMQNGNGSTDHLRNNIFLQATDVKDLSKITLVKQSSIMKFDLSNVPSEVGTLKKLIWTVDTENGFKSLELAFPTSGDKMVTFSGSNNTLTAYLAFLPEEMKVTAGGKFSVGLIGEGDRIYYVGKTITNGKDYVAGNRYTATIDGEWREDVPFRPFIIETTIADNADYTYDGFECQIGTWNETGSEQITLGYARIDDGKAYINADLSLYADKDIWVCIPKVVKFFHKLTSDEVNSKKLTLPDKDKGSTLKSSPTIGDKKYVNDWIVALYMGVNKDGSTESNATPLYWATGNLIATKTNEANSGKTTTVFHIATYDELIKQGTTDNPSTHYDATPESGVIDGYSGCAFGSQWNLFGFGDATGLMTTVDIKRYASEVNKTGDSICGNSKYDIARAQLGKNWRLPSSGNSINNEFAWFADDSFNLSPNGTSWYNNETKIGLMYTYTANTKIGNITNTLLFPNMGYRHGANMKYRASEGNFWSGTAYKSDQGYSMMKYGTSVNLVKKYRYMGLAVYPLSE